MSAIRYKVFFGAIFLIFAEVLLLVISSYSCQATYQIAADNSYSHEENNFACSNGTCLNGISDEISFISDDNNQIDCLGFSKKNIEKVKTVFPLSVKIFIIAHEHVTLPGYFRNNSNTLENPGDEISEDTVIVYTDEYLNLQNNIDISDSCSQNIRNSIGNEEISFPQDNLPIDVALDNIIQKNVILKIYRVFSSIKFYEYRGGDSLKSPSIKPHPTCTIPSYSVFEILPDSCPMTVKIYIDGDSLTYEFSEKGGLLEIPDVDCDYIPIDILIDKSDRKELFHLTLYSERWMEVFCDIDIQCAVLWDGARPIIWTLVTTGKDNWTRAEHCRILGKDPVAYFVLNRAPMRWWMSIQDVFGTKNGTHAPLRGTWWRLGRQGSHGCIRNPFAERFYQLMEVGDRVEVYYKTSEGFLIQEINPAWRYLRFDPIENVHDTSDMKQYVDKASERLIPVYEEKLIEAWAEQGADPRL